MSDGLGSDYSPAPILAAADRFRGAWVDLDQSLEIDAVAFARGRKALCSALAAVGLGRGDRVLMAIGNGPLFPAALTAILECGGSPLLVHSETPVAELQRVAQRFGARFLACDSDPARDFGEFTPQVRTVSGGTWLQVHWAEWPEAGFAGRSAAAQLAGVPLHPTSGTTGHPRVAARPGARAMAEAQHWVESIGVDRNDIILAVPPMSHAYAFGGCVMTPLLTSARVLTMRRFSPKLVFRALAAAAVTLMPTVPVTLDLLTFGAGNRLRQPRLRVITAGTPLPQPAAHQFKTISGITARSLYGTTETGIIAVTPPDFDAPTGCVGRPMHGVDVMIEPAPDATALGSGVGRVYVRSSSLMAGYVADGLLDTSALAAGWFRTGDLGRLDGSGMLHLVGRETDVINVFGMKVIPNEVEEVIAAVAEVAEVKVYAGQRSNSQYVKAAIVGKGDLDLAAIRAHCKKHLVYYKRPATIHVLARLPRTASGKVICTQLP